MGADGWLTVAVVVCLVALLVSERVPAAPAVLGAVVVLLLLDVVTAAQAFAGFSNPAPITVAALYVVAGAVQKTGLLAWLTGRTLGDPTGRGARARLLLPAAAASAFLNNTPIVAMLIQPVLGWCDRAGISPSRFLMPLSYAVVLGGMVTLLGSSTNLVVSGLLEQTGEQPLGLFELTPVGLPIAVLGLLVLLVSARWLLPERTTGQQRAEEEFREFTVAMSVVPGGAVDGATVTRSGLRNLRGVFLVEVERGADLVAPVDPDFTLRADDRLTFVGRSDQVVDLHRIPGLRSAEQEHLLAVDSPHHTFYEAVVGSSSPLVGRTLKEADFRGRYLGAVVAIHRSGRRVDAKLGAVRLRPADTLLVVANRTFDRSWRDRRDFLVVARLGGPPPTAGRRAPAVAVITALMVLTAAVGLLPILESALVAVAALVLSRAMTLQEVRESVDLDVVVLMAAAFGLGAALQTTGVAGAVADVVVPAFGVLGAFGLVLGIVVVTSVLTELITNAAAAALVFPLAMSVAAAGDLDPRAVAVAVAIAASASFLSPIGYQTNTMVYGPGGYRFSDYARLGAPLTLTVLVGVTVLTTLRA